MEAPLQAPSSSSGSSLSCRQLIINTDTSEDGRPQSSPLLRSLSVHNSHYNSPPLRQLSPATTVPPSPLGTQPTPPPPLRQTSCPEVPSGRQRVDFITNDLVFSKWLSCIVSHVDDPENFYCQLTGDSNADKLEAVMSHIDKYVSCLPPGIGKLRTATLGQPVVAKYSQDNKWYRARVTGD